MVARPVAVVGAGPSGIFATAELLKRTDVHVDVFDAAPTPFGLVRYGVAPDHPRIKSVTATLSAVLADPRVRFHGNVRYGTDLHLPDLQRACAATLFATGAPRSRRLGIPGEDLPGNHAAADLVSWYNGHPDGRQPGWDRPARTVAVIGGGNVSLDVARVLLKGGAGLATTDVPDDVLTALDRYRVSQVHVIARRGAVDVRFSPAELRELDALGCDIVVDPADLELTRDEQARCVTDRAATQRREIFATWAAQSRAGTPKRLTFLFHRRTVAVTGPGRVGSLQLEGPGGSEELAVEAVVRSIGHHGEPLPGLPFDAERGLVPNVRGRVAAGIHVAGWIKRGPSGVIGSNKACAIESVRELLAELDEGPAPDVPLGSVLRDRGCHVVDWPGWTGIDAAEIALGRERGRARTKIVDRGRLLTAAAATTR